MASKNNYKCIVTGIEKYIPPKMAAKKIQKFGTESEFRLCYISPDAAKLLRAGSTVNEVREQLGGKDLPDIDPYILTKQNLIRKKKGIRAIEEEKKIARDQYLRSKEYKDKMADLATQRANMTERQYIEYATGGPNNCQVEFGGTCARPDIFLSWNNKACDGCDYYIHCLCYNKRLSTDKKKPKRR